MKKKFVVVCIALLSLFSVRPVVFAQTSVLPVVENDVSETTSPATMKNEEKKESENEYVLPYPGILADHPLYFLKKIRDSILELLIMDPIRKIEFYILQSDKELSAALMLMEKKNTASMEVSVDRAIVYKEKAVDQTKSVKAQGREIPGYIIERLSRSLDKQSGVQSDISSVSTGVISAVSSIWKQKVNDMMVKIDALK